MGGGGNLVVRWRPVQVKQCGPSSPRSVATSLRRTATHSGQRGRWRVAAHPLAFARANCFAVSRQARCHIIFTLAASLLTAKSRAWKLRSGAATSM